MKYSRKGQICNQLQCQVPLASQGWQQSTWIHSHRHCGWHGTRCTLQTSSPPHCKLSFGEHVCKGHLVQFQLKYTRVHVWVHVLASLDWCIRTWAEVYLNWVCEVLPYVSSRGIYKLNLRMITTTPGHVHIISIHFYTAHWTQRNTAPHCFVKCSVVFRVV